MTRRRSLQHSVIPPDETLKAARTDPILPEMDLSSKLRLTPARDGSLFRWIMGFAHSRGTDMCQNRDQSWERHYSAKQMGALADDGNSLCGFETAHDQDGGSSDNEHDSPYLVPRPGGNPYGVRGTRKRTAVLA